MKYGLCHQLRVDHGREFSLSLFTHCNLRRFGPTDIDAYFQTPSTQVFQ